MSGIGNFRPIGSGNNAPQVINGGVDNAVEPNQGGPAAGGLNGNPPAVDARLEQTNRLVATLDTLLVKAAKTTTTAVDAKALAASIKNAGLPKATRKEIEKAAKAAQTSFLAINKFSGSKIAAAFVFVAEEGGGGSFDWNLNNTAAAQQVKATVKNLQSSLFRRDFLENIAKPGWFD